jgi:hypothetical protein
MQLVFALHYPYELYTMTSGALRGGLEFLEKSKPDY